MTTSNILLLHQKLKQWGAHIYADACRRQQLHVPVELPGNISNQITRPGT
jgi:hypothetical protein